MQRFSSKGKGGVMKSLALSPVFSTLFICRSFGGATTTISTNITAGGNLTVSGTAGITGLTTMVDASLTTQSLTGNLAVDGQVLLTPAFSDPSGFVQGVLYYNSTNKLLKLYDGASWFSIATTHAHEHYETKVSSHTGACRRAQCDCCRGLCRV